MRARSAARGMGAVSHRLPRAASPRRPVHPLARQIGVNEGMIARVNRRHFIASAAAAAGTLALPARVFAQPSGLDAKSTQILEIARREVARAGNVLWRRDIAGIADFATHSSLPRFHFANLENGTVNSFRVAHGLGSDPEHDGWLKWFSNQVGSNATARGAYISWE